MIIYNKAWLNNLYLHNDAEQLYNAGCLTADELKTIKENNKVGFYTPGVFIRAGLFILTWIVVTFTFSLFSLPLMESHLINGFGWYMFLGLLCVVVLEIMVKNKHYYKAGINDALLWTGFGLLTWAFDDMLNLDFNGYQHPHYLVLSLFVLVISLYFSLRYADMVTSVISCLAFFAVVFFAWQSIGSFGNATMPFIIMIVAAVMYTQVFRLAAKIKVPYYNRCLTEVQIVSLVILYAAGNYLVVDKLNNELNNIPGAVAPTGVKWGAFFWVWTMVLPLIYIIRGIIKKSSVVLRTGLVLFGGAVYTFRTYYHIINIELALMIGGVIILGIVYAVVRYLTTPKYGFTYADIDNAQNADNVKIEALFTAATLGRSHNAPTQPADKFGGGDFGGGGSGGTF